jgi:hypothetical protein
LNKSELAQRFNCDSRTIDRYLKISSGELEAKKSLRVYRSLIDDYKPIIIEKVDTYSATANLQDLANFSPFFIYFFY